MYVSTGRDLSYYTHTHTRLTALFPGLPTWAGTRKVKPIWILLEQETVSGSGISWAACKSAPRSRQTTTPAPHHSVFLQAGCPSCRPANSFKALKEQFELLYSADLLLHGISFNGNFNSLMVGTCVGFLSLTLKRKFSLRDYFWNFQSRKLSFT